MLLVSTLGLAYVWYRRAFMVRISDLVNDADGDGDHDADDVMSAFDTDADGALTRQELQDMLEAERSANQRESERQRERETERAREREMYDDDEQQMMIV